MSQRHSVSGRRSAFIWLSALIGLALIAALVILVLFVYPNYQRRQQVEQHYQAGVAFQETGDWDKAAEAFEQVVAIDADYNDTRTRLTEARTKQQEAIATAQAEAAQATATAQAQTMVAAATATAGTLAQLEDTYQKCLGAMNLERWADAKEACDQVFAIDPNYKDVQAKLGEIEETLAEIQISTPIPTPEPTPSTVEQLVEVRADLGWQDSSVFVSGGEHVTVQYVSGRWTYWSDEKPYSDADGPSDDYTCADAMPIQQCVEPIPDFNKGALVGKIGEQLLRIGNSLTFTAEDSGLLLLRINDGHRNTGETTDGGLKDNQGTITVRVTVQNR